MGDEILRFECLNCHTIIYVPPSEVALANCTTCGVGRLEISEKEEPGKKFDTGKTRWDLMDFGILNEVAEVITIGADRYGDDNYKKVKPFKPRYIGAAIRHWVAWITGEVLDPDTGKHHLAHMICNLIFLIWGDRNLKETDNVNDTTGVCDAIS